MLENGKETTDVWLYTPPIQVDLDKPGPERPSARNPSNDDSQSEAVITRSRRTGQSGPSRRVGRVADVRDEALVRCCCANGGFVLLLA